jgi:hypothetical protein
VAAGDDRHHERLAGAAGQPGEEFLDPQAQPCTFEDALVR